MIDIAKNLDGRGFLLILIVLLISTDIAILLNIPFLRQIFGFIFLSILPGLLILQTLKLSKLGFIEKFILSWGISISFLMFFGLLINNLSLSLGYETPLSTIPLLISVNIILILLCIVGYKINKEEDQVFSFLNINLNKSEKAFLIVPILFPALSISGMHVMNTTDNNIILMFLLFSIPIYVAFVCFFNQKFSNRIYPVVIFLISISLLLLVSLRSNHVLGVDTHVEYYYFQTTVDNMHWHVLTMGNQLDACLSVSILPTIYQSILNISSEFLFKILYSLLYSIVPLIIYVLSKKYIGDFYGFLAACFFMFHFNFLWTTANSRTCLAVLFFALAMMVLFSDRIEPLKKRILFIVFMVSCMVSHYSTTYIFFLIMLGTFVGIELLSKKHRFKKVISLTITILFFALIFFWYSQVTETTFNAGVSFVGETFTNLNRFFVEESRTGAFVQLAGHELTYPILSRVNLALTWCTFIFIGIGVLTMIKRYKEMIVISEVKRKKPDFLKTKFEMEYFMIALVCVGLLVIMVALPYISVGYDIWRLYSVVIVILSVCFIIGGMTLSHFFFFTKHFLSKERTCAKKECNSFGKAFLSKKRFVLKEKNNGSEVRAYLIILLILIPYSMFSTGVIYQLVGAGDSIVLNSEGRQYDKYYVHDQESCGAKWLKEYGEEKTKIATTDTYVGMLKLISQGNIPSSSIDRTSLQADRKIKGYIYLGYYNVVDGKLFGVEPNSCNLSDYSHQFVGKSTIYNNGGSEVWR